MEPVAQPTAQSGAIPAGPRPRFAVVDIETSGLSLRRHRILQVAVVTVSDGVIVDEWSSLIKLRWRWQRVGPRRVHGISRSDLKHAPHASAVLAELSRRLSGEHVVFTAHNVQFDWTFIRRAAQRNHVELPELNRLCTLRMSRQLDPERALSHRLSDLCERYGVSNDRPHDALHDARATAAVLPHLLAAHAVVTNDDLVALYDRRR